VADACERALASLYTAEKANPVSDAFRSGMDLIGRKMMDSLAKFRVTAISSVGQTFNPHLHEALMREETDLYTDQQIIAEFQKGYLVDGRLLRPAQVKVAVHPKTEDK
jgi:molecular chaperone GrpE